MTPASGAGELGTGAERTTVVHLPLLRGMGVRWLYYYPTRADAKPPQTTSF
jgi:hypothetical protein